MGGDPVKALCTQFWLAFELGHQTTRLLGTPAFLLTVLVEVKPSFLLVIDDVCIALHELFEFLLAGGDGKAASVQSFDGEEGISFKRFDLADFLRSEA